MRIALLPGRAGVQASWVRIVHEMGDETEPPQAVKFENMFVARPRLYIEIFRTFLSDSWQFGFSVFIGG